MTSHNQNTISVSKNYPTGKTLEDLEWPIKQLQVITAMLQDIHFASDSVEKTGLLIDLLEDRVKGAIDVYEDVFESNREVV